MGDRFFVHVNYRFNDVSQIFNSLFQGKGGDFIKIVKKCPSVHVFKHQIDILFFLEKSIKFNNIRMVEAGV